MIFYGHVVEAICEAPCSKSLSVSTLTICPSGRLVPFLIQKAGVQMIEQLQKKSKEIMFEQCLGAPLFRSCPVPDEFLRAGCERTEIERS